MCQTSTVFCASVFLFSPSGDESYPTVTNTQILRSLVAILSFRYTHARTHAFTTHSPTRPVDPSAYCVCKQITPPRVVYRLVLFGLRLTEISWWHRERAPLKQDPREEAPWSKPERPWFFMRLTRGTRISGSEHKLKYMAVLGFQTSIRIRVLGVYYRESSGSSSLPCN